MPGTWCLTDVASGKYMPDLHWGPFELGAAGTSVRKRRLHGGLCDGVDTIHIHNGAFAFTVLPTRGMGLWKAWRGDLEVGWKSPVRGPVHPAFVPLMEPSGLGWLDGFDELLVRCGLESNGAPEFDATSGRLAFPLHGRIANKPAHKVDLSVDAAGEITLSGVVDETRFHFAKLRLTTTIKTRPGEPGLRIRDEIENLSGSPATAQMLYHINFGQPLLDAGSQLVAPVQTLVPRTDHAAKNLAHWHTYPKAIPAAPEEVYFFKLASANDGAARVLLKNSRGDHGASVLYNTRQLPCFTLWKNPTAAADGYVTGLEPGTNYPNPRSHEAAQQRVISLVPGQRYAIDLALEIHATAAEVAASEAATRTLAATVTPTIHDQPLPGWCAGA